MNKSDIKFIIIILLLIIPLFFILKKDNKYAYVYYENKLIKTIDLKKDNKYIVDGFNGKVKLEVKNNKIRVIEEISPMHLCRKQGYSNTTPIVCLPNKIVIDFNNNDYDTIM